MFHRRWIPWVMILSLLALAGCGSKPPATDPGPASPPPATQGTGAPAPSQQPQRGGEIKIGLHRDPAVMDPHVSQGASSVSVQGNVYDTLVEYNEQGRLIGALAEKWETPDPATYIFHLRKGVQFHDGSAFDADDVIATFKRIGAKETNATRKATIDSMASYEAGDAHTVKVVLKSPTAVFLHELASNASYIVSADDVNKGFDFKSKTNGTGAFKLESWEPNSRYNLVRNPTYWKQGMPYLDKMIMVPIIDDKARVNALRSGEVDFAEYIPWQEMSDLSREFNLYRSQDTFNLVRLNQSKAPLDNKLVRQAINYIVDRNEVLSLAFGGQGSIITGPLQPPGDLFYYKELENHYRKDHARARELLKQAGYNSPADVPPIEFTVGVIAVHSQTAQVVQQQLKDFGLKINWKSVEVVRHVRTTGEYVMMQDGLNMGWPDPDYLRQYFHTKGSGHATGVKMSNKRLDEVLEQGVKSQSEAERKQLYLEAEKIVLDEAPWIFLFWRPQAEAAFKKVKGYASLPGGLGANSMNRLEHVWVDKTAK